MEQNHKCESGTYKIGKGDLFVLDGTFDDYKELRKILNLFRDSGMELTVRFKDPIDDKGKRDKTIEEI